MLVLYSFYIVAAPTEAYLVFKLMNTSNSGYLNMEEFYSKYLKLELFLRSI